MRDNLVLRKVYKLSMRIKMELFNGISWPRKLCVVQQDDVVFSPARAASRHFYSNFQKISTLQKILLAIPSGRVSAPYLYSYLELNCNSFTKMNSFEKILSLSRKVFSFSLSRIKWCRPAKPRRQVVLPHFNVALMRILIGKLLRLDG